MGGFGWRPSKRPSSALILDPGMRRRRRGSRKKTLYFVSRCNYICFLLILRIFDGYRNEASLWFIVIYDDTLPSSPLFTIMCLIRFVYFSQNSKFWSLCPKKYKTFYLWFSVINKHFKGLLKKTNYNTSFFETWVNFFFISSINSL